MTREEALPILNDEINHIKEHLRFKGKSQEYYTELGNLAEALTMSRNALAEEEQYCDRNICIQNDYNGIGCDGCIYKPTESEDD